MVRTGADLSLMRMRAVQYHITVMAGVVVVLGRRIIADYRVIRFATFSPRSDARTVQFLNFLHLNNTMPFVTEVPRQHENILMLLNARIAVIMHTMSSELLSGGWICR